MASLRELLGNVEGKKTVKSTQPTVSSQQKLTVEALETLIDMVKTDALTESETEELKSSIETIFNNVLAESYDEEEEYSEEDEYDPEYDNQIGDEDYAEEDDEYSEEGEEEMPEVACTNEECGWSGSAEELSYNAEDEEAEGVCPECGSSVEQLSDEEYSDEEEDEVWDEEDDYSMEDEESEDELEESVSSVERQIQFRLGSPNLSGFENEQKKYKTFKNSIKDLSEEEQEEQLDGYLLQLKSMTESLLHKTSSVDKKASKMYKKSAAGKKSMKLNARKRAKYATKISRCSEAGKTFSFKTMNCVKSNKRR